MNLKSYLEGIYDDQELNLINSFWLEREVVLNKITDVESFLKDCDNESLSFKKAGPHRIDDWENGWSGNGITNEFDDFPNIPYYFKKNTHVRLGERIYEDISGLTELCLLRTIQDIAFSNNILKNVNSIVEYGCGTGHNLTYLKSLINHELYGADWAQSAVEKLVENKIVKNGNAFKVDYFKPETYTSPKEPYVAFTNASLEQSGTNYKDFMNFLFKNDSCFGGIHIEPISDLVQPTHQLNISSINYTDKRGYLNGFYEFMKNSNMIISHANDYGIGSKFLSGYQLLIWSK
jgi:SAM-dependent methyltransferase